jgi:uncharacterized protein
MKRTEQQGAKPRTIRCPQCSGRAIYDETNAYRPFCSERCRLIDLGAWASDGYAIPGEPAPQQPREPDES